MEDFKAFYPELFDREEADSKNLFYETYNLDNYAYSYGPHQACWSMGTTGSHKGCSM